MLRQFLLQLWKEQNNSLGAWGSPLAKHIPGIGVEVQGGITLHTGGCLFKGM